MSKWKHISSRVRSKTFVPESPPPSSYTFTPNKDEVIESRFRLRYSTTCNSYYRDWSDAIDPSAQGVLPGWDKALYSVDSVHRLINEEVGQVYLERVPGSNTGCIKWHVNFGCCGLLVDEVTIRLSCVEDFGGEIVVTLMGNPSQKRVRYPIGSDYVTYTELENSSELTLTVHFVGEAGQVTRLFPQSILRGMGYPLDVQVILKPPLQSLGRPRMLVGLLYSSSQENEVDSRHYKQNTTNTGQGFLHIHLLRARIYRKGNMAYQTPSQSGKKNKDKKGQGPIVERTVSDSRRELPRHQTPSSGDLHRRQPYVSRKKGEVPRRHSAQSRLQGSRSCAQTKQVSQVLRFLKAKGGVSGGMKSDKEETVGTRESKVSFSDKDTVIANVNLSFAKWRKVSASGNPVTTVTTDKGAKAEIAKDAETTEMKAKNNTEGEQITSDETTNDKTSVDATKADTAENEPQSASSTSTEDIAAAWDSIPDPTTNSQQDLDASPEKCANVSVKESEVTDSTSAVENTTAVTEVSCGSSVSMQVNSKNKHSVEERLFRSVMTSIKQLDFEARYSAMPKDCSDGKELECFNEDSKGDDQTVVNSCSNEDFEKGEVLPTSDGLQNEDVGKEELEKQESCEISNQIIENDAEKENNGLNEIEAVQKGDLAENTPVLNDINTANEIKESGNGNSPEFSENSRQEDDQEKNDLKEIETQCNGDLTDEVFVLNEIKEANVVKNAESEKENPSNSSENSERSTSKTKQAK
ncbi:Peptide-N(4)-(N-acetyl-beta- glucosaminyl)asparagine amidase [Desmophyllum pertusum]|uniref:Peptide-N(4)-(N-acetyl-beta-glucosaminyl)asparagine amidase n=1 Tax=Desmophyllum pertusum TaxID=174260 RepID=A0A9W9ZXV1_9CNID|nr:Peptide-N(4)-(N-acetyl-beta- glucosaminyl)asparagine amidase [Desmophyllum pertusum]